MSSIFKGLGPSVLATLPTTVWASLKAADFAGLTAKQAAELTATELAQTDAAAFAGFTRQALAAVPSDSLSALTEPDVAQLQPAALAGLDVAQLDALGSSNFAGLEASQIAALTPATLSALPSALLASITPGELTAAEIDGLSPNAFAHLTPAQLNAFTAADIAGLTAVQAANLNGAELSDIDAAAFAGFTATTLAAVPAAALGAATPSDVARLRPAAIGALSAAQLNALSDQAFARLLAPEVASLTPARLSGIESGHLQAISPGYLTTAQIGALSATVLAKLTAAQFDSFTAKELHNVTAAEVALLAPADFAGLSPSQIGDLASPALSGLKAPDLAALDAAQLAALGARFEALPFALTSSLPASELPDLVNAALGAFTVADFDRLTSDEVKAISTRGIRDIAPGVIGAVAANFIDDLSPDQIAALTPTQVKALTQADILGLSGQQFAALDVAAFSAQQVKGLTVDEMASVSLVAFDQGVAPNIAYLPAYLASQLTDDELQSLTPTEDGEITLAQYNDMDPRRQAIVAANGALVQSAKRAANGGWLTYSAALHWLEQAASQPMNALSFAELNDVLRSLNTAGGIAASPFVAQLLDDVIGGNSANASWHGGSSAATPLGDLTANSSQTQFKRLISKWFLGGDLPSTDVASVADDAAASGYLAQSMPLFGANGPSYRDINQGQTGDCFFLAALGETALTDPSLIERMIQPLGNGIYCVDFQVDGEDDFVTVNDRLPVYLGNYSAQDGSPLAFDNSATLWSPLIEKAYAELVEQTAVTPGSSLNANENSYAAISGGWDNGLAAITGQTTADWGVESAMQSGEGDDLLQQISNALQTHDDVLLATPDTTHDRNLIDDHMFDVVAVDMSAQTITLYNPWGADATALGLKARFSISLTEAANEGTSILIAQGAAAAR